MRRSDGVRLALQSFTRSDCRSACWLSRIRMMGRRPTSLKIGWDFWERHYLYLYQHSTGNTSLVLNRDWYLTFSTQNLLSGGNQLVTASGDNRPSYWRCDIGASFPFFSTTISCFSEPVSALCLTVILSFGNLTRLPNPRCRVCVDPLPLTPLMAPRCVALTRTQRPPWNCTRRVLRPIPGPLEDLDAQHELDVPSLSAGTWRDLGQSD